ncbi:MAG: uracil-DNA glycosylase [bacterium]
MENGKNLLDEYLEIVVSLKNYVEENIQLGILEIPKENNNDNAYKDDLFENISSKNYQSMMDIRLAVENCQLCSLHKTRTNVVFGAGNEKARLIFVGEAPGSEEDAQGMPFVGKAGQKLTQIIQAIGLTREEVYITNVLKCRPPNNRNPLPEEIRCCEPYLVAQLKFIKPETICALGTFAAQTLLKTDQPISKLRGRFHTYQGIRLMPTYHPAFILRNPQYKRDVWEDVQKLVK